jgi:endonuclease YncB( thermonuclease family)
MTFDCAFWTVVRSRQSPRNIPHGLYRLYRTIDGDTIKAYNNNGVFTVRLADIDTPELKQKYGKESKSMLNTLLSNTYFSVTSSGFDKYGRVLGTVYVGELNINLEMLYRGCAHVFVKYCNPENIMLYSQAMEYAKSTKKGLWQFSPVVTPEVFRTMFK